MIWSALVDPVRSVSFCLTLLHSVWQVALLAVAARGVDLLWRRLSVERRYMVNVAALLAAVAAMPITFALVQTGEWSTDRASVSDAGGLRVDPAEPALEIAPAEDEPIAAAGTGDVVGRREVTDRAGDSRDVALSVASRSGGRLPAWSALAPGIFSLYIMGVSLMLARLVVAVVRANRLGVQAVPMTEGPHVEAVRALAQQWSMKVVPVLARSEQIVVPRVIGLVQATILLPASAVTGLTIREI